MQLPLAFCSLKGKISLVLPLYSLCDTVLLPLVLLFLSGFSAALPQFSGFFQSTWKHGYTFHPELFPNPIRLPNIHSQLAFIRLSLLSSFSMRWDPLHWCSFLAKSEVFLPFRSSLMWLSGWLALPHTFFLSTLSFGEPVLSAFYFYLKHCSFSTSSGRSSHSLSTICWHPSNFHPQSSSFYLYSLYFD